MGWADAAQDSDELDVDYSKSSVGVTYLVERLTWYGRASHSKTNHPPLCGITSVVMLDTFYNI